MKGGVKQRDSVFMGKVFGRHARSFFAYNLHLGCTQIIADSHRRRHPRRQHNIVLNSTERICSSGYLSNAHTNTASCKTDRTHWSSVILTRVIHKWAKCVVRFSQGFITSYLTHIFSLRLTSNINLSLEVFLSVKRCCLRTTKIQIEPVLKADQCPFNGYTLPWISRHGGLIFQQPQKCTFPDLDMFFLILFSIYRFHREWAFSSCVHEVQSLSLLNLLSFGPSLS